MELPEGNNVVPLRSDTIRLMQNECLFHGLRSEDPNQHLKEFLKIVDSFDLNVENRERTRLLLFQLSLRDQASNWLELPHHGLDLWLQVQIFYDHVDCTTQMAINYAAGGKLKKLRPEAWETIDEFVQYEEEWWDEPIFLEKGSLNHENANMEQILENMECQVDSLMKDAISLIGKSEDLYGLSSNEIGNRPDMLAQGGENSMRIAQQNAKTVKQEHMILEFWSTIEDGVFSVKKMFAKRIQDPRIRLSTHRCIATTISGRRDSTQRVTVMDLFYLYCIYSEGVVCNIPYWLAHYLSGVRDKGVVYSVEGTGSSSGVVDGPAGWALGTARDMDDPIGSAI
ncbi:hypothetical protein Tco_0714966 [Tanacetum coccineum]